MKSTHDLKNTTAKILSVFLALVVTASAVSAQEHSKSVGEKASITLGNNESIYFLNASGTNDGTEIRRFPGNALRFRFVNTTVFDSLANDPFQIRDASGFTIFYIDPDGHAHLRNPGNFGVGRSPSSGVKLDILGDGVGTGIRYLRTDAKDARIQVGDPTQTWSMAVGWAGAGDFSIIEEQVAGNRLYIQRGGNVGISTSNPTERLEVNGNIKLNGNIVSDGDICIGSGCP